MQKFTRPITREIELAGDRLALTLTEQGLSVRPVGSRKPPKEASWAKVLCQLAGQTPTGEGEPSAADVTAALEALKKGEASQRAAAPASPPSAAPLESTADAHRETRQPAAAPASSGGATAILERLGQWLHQHRRRYAAGLLPGASAAELDATQTALGITLPPDLRALLTWHNGQSGDFIGHLENNWDLMSAGRIMEAKHELDAGDRTQTGWQPAWLPFLEDDDGNHLFLDTSQPGNPVREFWQGNPDHATAAPSLAAWLEQFVAAVEKGQYHEDSERGTFLKSHA